jgi:hypothetical protein
MQAFPAGTLAASEWLADVLGRLQGSAPSGPGTTVEKLDRTSSNSDASALPPC